MKPGTKNIAFIYHIEVSLNKEITNVEMRRDYLTPKSIYLQCTYSKFKTKVSISAKLELPIERIISSKRNHEFAASVLT